MENGEWRNGKWKMENGKWKMENGKWRMTGRSGAGEMVLRAGKKFVTGKLQPYWTLLVTCGQGLAQRRKAADAEVETLHATSLPRHQFVVFVVFVVPARTGLPTVSCWSGVSAAASVVADFVEVDQFGDFVAHGRAVGDRA